MKSKKLISILGPTASGKTALAVDWALKLNTEVLSCDSRQFFKEMHIGTAMPRPEELKGVPHHFLGHLSIHDDFSAGDYERQALKQLTSLFEKQDTVIQVGGSGLYAHALMFGMPDAPPSSEQIRKELSERVQAEGIAFLQALLLKEDPVYCAQADMQNPQRLIRAAEVFLHTGKAFSSFKSSEPKERPFENEIYVLDWSRDELYERINQRVLNMMDEGLLEEVMGLQEYKDLNALNTVGYKELFSHLAGEMSLAAAIAEIQKNTRRYAKRQLTWFKKTPGAQFIHPSKLKELMKA